MKIRVSYQYTALAIKIVIFFWVLFPAFLIYSAISSIKSKRFLKKNRILSYLKKHATSIEGIGDLNIYDLEVDKIRKGVSNLVWRQTLFFDNGRRLTLVGKKILPFGSFITFVSSYLGPLPKRIPMSPSARFKQEIDALNALKSDSVYTPRAVFSDEKEKLLLMEYIPGIDAGDFLEEIESTGRITGHCKKFFYDCGTNLALLHRFGLSLISHNDRSRLAEKSNGRIYFMDFELSTNKDYKAWDISIFMHWIRIKLSSLSQDKTEEIQSRFIAGYESLEPINHKSVQRHLEDLAVYIPFARLGMWINRGHKKTPSVTG